jgi:cytochrome d ubiquinol oxidase subunit II
MPTEMLQILAYLIVGASVALYVVLDGFDLGVGLLQIFAGKDEHRRILLNSIGPFWDGNEVWLIAIFGALFVAFPDVYAVLLSGFYLLIMLMLLGFIIRGVAIEFRSKEKSLRWRYFWDGAFWFSSMIITFSLGVILGNLLLGVPITVEREMDLPMSEVFHPYSVFIGMFAISLFATHGSLFLLMKTEGELQHRLHNFAKYLIPLFYFFFVTATIWTWETVPHITEAFIEQKIFFIAPAVLIFFMACLPIALAKKRYGYCFLSSMITIVLLFLLIVIGTFPDMIPSSLDYSRNTLTLYNASSQRTTLIVTMFIAAFGIPLVFLYGTILYTIFRGKTRLTDHSY